MVSKIQNKYIDKYRKEFQKDLQIGKTVIIIPEVVVRKFEQQCLSSVQLANAFLDWRARSARLFP